MRFLPILARIHVDLAVRGTRLPTIRHYVQRSYPVWSIGHLFGHTIYMIVSTNQDMKLRRRSPSHPLKSEKSGFGHQETVLATLACFRKTFATPAVILFSD